MPAMKLCPENGQILVVQIKYKIIQFAKILKYDFSGRQHVLKW